MIFHQRRRRKSRLPFEPSLKRKQILLVRYRRQKDPHRFENRDLSGGSRVQSREGMPVRREFSWRVVKFLNMQTSIPNCEPITIIPYSLNFPCIMNKKRTCILLIKFIMLISFIFQPLYFFHSSSTSLGSIRDTSGSISGRHCLR